MSSKTEFILGLVAQERVRQRQLYQAGEHDIDCSASFLGDTVKLPILLEEVGEVARAINDDEPLAALRNELIQVAAVAVAWAESL